MPFTGIYCVTISGMCLTYVLLGEICRYQCDGADRPRGDVEDEVRGRDIHVGGFPCGGFTVEGDITWIQDL